MVNDHYSQGYASVCSLFSSWTTGKSDLTIHINTLSFLHYSFFPEIPAQPSTVGARQGANTAKLLIDKRKLHLQVNDRQL